jgi:hypothetical protein
MGKAVRTDLTPRLQAAAEAVAQAKQTLGLKLQHRNELIVQAVDEGMTQAAAAQAAKVHPSTVTAILAGSQAAYETVVSVEASAQ